MATTDHWFREAFTQHQAGRLERAEQLYRRVLRAQPRHVRALYLLGSLHAQRADYANALPWLEQALALDGTSVEAHNNRGVALKEVGRWDEALESYDRALALRPTYAEAHNNRAVALHARGRLDEALAAYDTALTHRPDYADAHNNRGLTLKDLARFDDALASYDAALRANPDYAQAHNNRGVVLQKMKRFGEAVESQRHALALNPQSAESLNNLGAALEELGYFDEARACFERALNVSPNYAEAHCNLGNCLQAQGRLADAVACYDHALALPGVDPTNVRWNRALTLLLSGDFAAGFAAYECRFDSQPVEIARYDAPRWDGVPLDGKTLLVHAEQGVGDTFQFVRFLPLVQAQGAKVIFECQPGLKTLLNESLPDVEIVERPPDGPPSALPHYDVHAPLLSLPHLLGTTLETVPGDVPYLRVPPTLAAHWRAQVEDAARAVGGTVKIGLVWAGNPSHKNDHNRSCALSDFAPLARIPGVALFSLQRGPAAVQADSPPLGMTIVDIGAAVSDFADTAAVLQALDLVIAVDTSIAHLAGALGRPVWTLLPQAPDWRWMLGRADSPWYPTMHLFRQATTGDWAGVVGEVVLTPRPPSLKGKGEQKEGEQERGSETLPFEGRDSRAAAGLGLRDAEAAFAAGDLARAAAALEQVLTLDPDNVRAWNDVAVLAHAQGDLDAAFAALNRALALDPDNRTARENREQCAAARQQDENPLVSIIMPCYKQAHFLAEAVQSVVAQTYEHWELIIIDDGSPDNTAQTAQTLIARCSDKNIRLLRQENAGLSRARNAGVEQSRGTLIFPLDSDDTIHPLMLEKTVDALRRNPEAAIAYTDVQMFGMEEGVWQTGPLTLAEQSQKTMIQYGALFRRTLFEALGGYAPMEAFEDWDFWLRALEHGFSGVCVPEPLLRYRKTSWSKLAQDNQTRAKFVAEMVVKHRAFYPADKVAEAETLLAATMSPPGEETGTRLCLLADAPQPELVAALRSVGWQVECADAPPADAANADVLLAVAAPNSPLLPPLARWPTEGPRLIIALADKADGCTQAGRSAGSGDALRTALERAEAVVVASPDGHAARLLSDLHCTGVVIPPPACPVTPAPGFRARFGIPDDAPLLVCPGDWTPERNQAALLDALAGQPGAWHLAVIGKPSPEWPDLPEHLAFLAARDPRFHLVTADTEDDIAAALAEAALLLLPSRAEPTPTVLGSAQRLGLPFVATSMCGAAPAHAGGLVVPLTQFADAAAFLLADDAARATLSDAGRAHARAVAEAVPSRWAELLGGASALGPLPVPAEAMTATFALRNAFGNLSFAQARSPQISVVIPTFNRLPLLRKVLTAYKTQTLPPEAFEVVVVDDGSTDGTREFLENYRPAYGFQWERLAENGGLSAARNWAILAARGEIIVFSDDDDAPTPDYLEQHEKTHRQNPSENWGAFARIEPSAELENSVINAILTRSHGMYNYFDYLSDGDILDFRHFWGNVVSVKRSFLIRNGLFDEATRAQEDAELGWRLRRAGLRLIHNQNAVLRALRTFDHAQFCRRQYRIGQAGAWLTRKHADPDIPHWLGLADAHQRWPAVEKKAQDAESVVEQLAVLEKAGLQAASQMPGWDETIFPALTDLCRAGFQRAYLSGYLDALAEWNARDEKSPPPIGTDDLVSIVIPCYNYARYLPGAIASLAAQTFPHWEAVIVDDGSTDDSVAVAQRLVADYPQHRITLITQSNTGHPSHARNVGIAATSGPYVLCLDADDEIAPTFLADCVRLLHANPSLSYAYTDQERFGDDGWRAPFYAGDYTLESLLHYLPWGICTLFRRQAWEAVGGWKAVGFEDWDFWLSCGERGHHGRRIPKPLYRYRKHPQGRYLTDERKGLAHKAHLVLNHPSLHSLARQRWATGVLAGETWREEVLTPRPPSLEGKGESVTFTEQGEREVVFTLPFEGRDSREAAGLGCPLVSVMVFVSSPARLAETLASLRTQTYEDWEVVIVNGEKEMEDGGRVKTLALPEDAGRGAAWNAGLEAATGKYVAFLEAGDTWQTEHLETLVEFLEANPYRAAYTDAARVNPETGETETLPGQAFDYEQILVANFVPGVSLLCERACLSVTGGFDTSLPAHEDWDMWIRLSRAFDIVHLPRTTAQAARDWDDGVFSARAAAAIYQKHHAHARENAAVLHAQAAALRHLDDSAPDPLAEAEARFADGDRDGARALLRALTSLEPANARAWNDLAVIAWQDGDLETALAAFGRALDADPDDAATRLNCADVLRALGQTEDAALLAA